MTSPAPIVSLLMPAKQAHRTIVDAIESVTRNRLDAWEILIQADDASDYGYLTALFGPRVVVLPPAEGLGPGPARNRCLRAATGDFVSLLDADDELDGGYLDALLPEAVRHGSAYALTRYFSGARSVRLVVPPERFGAEYIAQANGAVRGLVERRYAGMFGEGLCEDAVFEALAIRTSNRQAVRGSAIYHARINVEAEAQMTNARLVQLYQQGQAFASKLSGGLSGLVLDLLKERLKHWTSFHALGVANESYHEYAVREAVNDAQLAPWPSDRVNGSAAGHGGTVLERVRRGESRVGATS